MKCKLSCALASAAAVTMASSCATFGVSSAMSTRDHRPDLSWVVIGYEIDAVVATTVVARGKYSVPGTMLLGIVLIDALIATVALISGGD
jgi:hypothetical protein